jgi:hypothetical protein
MATGFFTTGRLFSTLTPRNGSSLAMSSTIDVTVTVNIGLKGLVISKVKAG